MPSPSPLFTTGHACVTIPHHPDSHLGTHTHIRGLRPSFLDSIYAFPYRPAKKRCQFRVIYNIPVAPAVDATNADGTEAKPTMSANPTQCPSAALKIAGDCIHCSKVFCSAHRTPETHNCTGMQACRDAAFQANKERLERERTVASKIAQA